MQNLLSTPRTVDIVPYPLSPDTERFLDLCEDVRLFDKRRIQFALGVSPEFFARRSEASQC